MSQGSFIRARYASNAGVVHAIRVQPETVTSWNPQASGEVNGKGTVKATPSRRKKGLFARYVVLSRKVGTDDGPFTGGTIQVRIPIFTVTAWTGITEGSELEYQGVEFTVASKGEERFS